MGTLCGSSVVQQFKPLLEADLDGEILLMNVEEGTTHGFNKTGSFIWNLIREPISVRFISKQLVLRYAIDEVICEQQVLVFLHELCNLKLIVNCHP